MQKTFIFFLLTISFAFSKDYTLYVASSKYLNAAKNYYKDIRFHTPDFYDVVMRTHIKKDYSIIIRHIPTIKKAKRIQKLLQATNKYKNTYIKSFEQEPIYNIIKIKNNSNIIPISKKIYKQDIESTNEYITASIMYNTKQYKKSYEIFYKLFLKDNYNLNINYFLAKSAFNIKKLDESTAAFERVLILKPNFNQARYDFAKVLFKVGQKKEARKEFNKLLKTNINQKTKLSIKSYIKAIDKKNTKKNISGRANIMIGFSRSSNVNGGLSSSEYDLPGYNLQNVTGEKPIIDNAISQLANVEFYNYIKDKPIKIKNLFLVYNKTYFKEKDEEIRVFSYKPSLTYYNFKNRHSFTLETEISRIVKNTNEDFYTISISPKFTNENFFTYFKYQNIKYLKEENKEKDYQNIQLFVNINLFKNISIYTNIYKNIRLKELRTDIDKYTIGNGINYLYNIAPNNILNFNYQFEKSQYKYENAGFNSKRKDTNHLFEVSNRYYVNKGNMINSSITYINNISNQAAYENDEKIISISYLKDFMW